MALPAQARDLVVAAADPVGSLKDRMCQEFVNGVREELPDVGLNFVQGEALGSAKSVMEQHVSGTIDIFCNELVWFANYVPDMQILGWGFTFRDPQHMVAFIESDLFDPLEEQAIAAGVRILGARPTQPRMLFTKEQVNGLEDLQNIKMRVPQLKSYLELWTAIGTQPTQVAWSEVYLALNTGVVVAAEGPPSDAGKQNFQKAAPFVTRTDHLYSTVHISINERAWATLDEAQRAKMKEIAETATDWGMAQAEKETTTVLEGFEADGATISDIDIKPFQDKVAGAVEKMEAEGLWSAGLWQKIQGL
ncbi:TRAP transporter substrate-binding protein [Oceanicola sp. 502str15]|uniref:TRAP transporter substrate-binding protein n=1 Tax=Oceanicola sp. 502str15 TaxID=2696061 RepID=UPI002095A52C|nr:TRAP transporter substrate-binding protein [Oceanicola sp. 502str15]MCO6381480.1 TRAP transporter substrate-binding protein DctP [Oceanicola sp. 502str15]